MKITSLIAKILVFTMLVSTLPSSLSIARAEEKAKEAISMEISSPQNETIEEEINEDIKNEIELENTDSLDLEVTNASDNKIEVESSYESDDLTADFDLEMNVETGKIKFSTEVLENEVLIKEEYTVLIDEEDGEIIPIFINDRTGETFEADPTKLHASAIPVIAYVIGGIIVRSVVKKVGSKIVLNIGKKQFISKTKSEAKKAAQKALTNFKTQTIKVGSKSVKITKDRMEHILVRHHPRYWNGTYASKKEQSFFDPDLSVNDIKNIIANGVRKNASKIEKGMKKNEDTVFYTTVNKVKYKIVVSNKGTIRTCFPQK
ncbi:hypothetical protein CHH83_15015 [Bacillus sp. 7586-K]|uniref:SAR2788 family putative toxin n=1 Tax=Metabacillus niabensis TaxID=324854 RepID=UPI000BA7547F|nr:hypothetical protein CHH83_15015 [Bacillus sp. 7586-K]